MEVEKNYLVLGNAPCLLDELKGKDLSGFDKVIRVNAWEPIQGYDNRCTTWLYYPGHHIGEFESRFDVFSYLADRNLEVWIGHEFMLPLARKQLEDREPGKIFTDAQKAPFQIETGIQVPTTGMIAIWMALHAGAEVHVAGFNLFKDVVNGTGELHYYEVGKTRDTWTRKVPAHDKGLSLEYLWYHNQLDEGELHRL